MNFLVVGYGSIGKRHSAILRELGHKVTTVDPSPQAGADYANAGYRLHKREGLSVSKKTFAGVLDCTPSDIRAGWAVPAQARFIEKPLGDGPDVKLPCPVQVGFCYRYLPSLREFVESLLPARVYSVLIVGGQYLPNWHGDYLTYEVDAATSYGYLPNGCGVDYRTRYHGTPGRGGVILDSLPHSLFVARWIFGDVQLVGSVAAKLSGLDIRTEDTAAVLLEAPTGQPCLLLADYLRKPRGFYIEAVASGGVKRWEFDPDEADTMYLRQMQAFVEICKGERSYGFPDYAEGVAVQRLLDETGKGGA